LRKKFIALGIAAAVGLGALLSGCSSDADTVSVNLSTEAEQFRITRHITVINGFTDQIVMEVEGRCSVETGSSSLAGAFELTCKIADDEYIKNYVWLGDNAIVSVEQVETADVSVYHYEWIIKPEGLIPAPIVETGTQ
jgi:hypothetical protein